MPGVCSITRSQLSDLTFGTAALGLDGAYRFNRDFSAGVAVSYGLVIPKRCGTAGECTASLGHDATLGLLGRWHIDTWGAFEPDVDLQLGYEWFGAKHVDGDIRSTRSFRGFEAEVRGHGQLRISRVFSLGPMAEVSAGTFSRASLEAPSIDHARETDGTTVHVWVVLGFRAFAAW